MRRSINTFQAMEMPHVGEKNGGLSETIPGQAISATELLRRFATGQPLGFKNVTPVYDDDPHHLVPEFYKLNQLDRLHFLQENAENVKTQLSLYKRIEQQQQQQKQEEQKKKQEDLKMADPDKRSTLSEKAEA